jgi:N-acetyl-gamma-glutamyl-phosphate reductase
MIAGRDVSLIFTPHLVPMDRGILTTAYARRSDRRSEGDLLEILRAAYRDCPFVRVSADLPSTKHSAHTNFCDMTLRVVGERVIVVSCLDNLIKGASGAAVQNLNVMFGLPEAMGLA